MHMPHTSGRGKTPSTPAHPASILRHSRSHHSHAYPLAGNPIADTFCTVSMRRHGNHYHHALHLMPTRTNHTPVTSHRRPHHRREPLSPSSVSSHLASPSSLSSSSSNRRLFEPTTGPVALSASNLSIGARMENMCVSVCVCVCTSIPLFTHQRRCRRC